MNSTATYKFTKKPKEKCNAHSCVEMLSIGFMRSSMAQGYELTCMHSNTVVNVSVGQSVVQSPIKLTQG